MPELDISSIKKFDKMKFSMVIPEVDKMVQEVKPKSAIVVGIEVSS